MIADWLTVLLIQPDFAIRVGPRGARCWRGKVSPRFVEECTLIARDTDLRDALILGCRRSRGLVLEFRRVPEPVQQRLRNVWLLER